MQHNGTDQETDLSQDGFDKNNQRVSDDNSNQQSIANSSRLMHDNSPDHVLAEELAEVKSLYQDAMGKLQQADQTIAGLKQRQAIDSILIEEDVMDLDVVRLLVETATESKDSSDLRSTINNLRASKPYLFKTIKSNTPFLPARIRHGQHLITEDAAERASVTGQRQDLLRYLRLRRSK